MNADTENDTWYCDKRTKEMMSLLIECLDALPAISLASARLHNIDLNLNRRIEKVLLPWKCEDGEDGI